VQDSEKIFRDAAALNLTGSGYAWIVTEKALTAPNTPKGIKYFNIPYAANLLIYNRHHFGARHFRGNDCLCDSFFHERLSMLYFLVCI